MEVGEVALVILKYKVSHQGIDLRPSEFGPFITKRAQLIGCSREELLAFFNKYLVPDVLRICELTNVSHQYTPSEREAKIAYRLLKMGFFWHLRGLRDEVCRIAEKTSLEYALVAAIVTDIARKHLRDEFCEGDDLKLEVDGEFELK